LIDKWKEDNRLTIFTVERSELEKTQKKNTIKPREPS